MLHSIRNGYQPQILAKEADILTMGITPSGSGKLHEGHYMTLFNLLRCLTESREKIALLFIDDREFTNQTPFSIPDNAIVGITKSCLQSFIQLTSNYLHNESIRERVSICCTSDFFKQTGLNWSFMGTDFLELLLVNREKISQGFRSNHYTGKRGISCVCPNCMTGLKRRGEVKYFNIKTPEMNGYCLNKDCSQDRFSINLEKGEHLWGVHYTLVALIDILLSRSRGEVSVLDIFGGDYDNEPWGDGGTTKSEKIYTATELIHPGRIHHYVGPTLLSGEKKLSKSRGDFVDIPNLDRLLRILESGDPSVDMSVLT